MGYRLVPTHVQAARDTHDRMVKMVEKKKRERDRSIEQARGRTWTYPMWAQRRWALRLSRVSFTYVAFCTVFMVVTGVAAGPLVGLAVGLGVGVVSRRIVKRKERQILAWRYPKSQLDERLEELRDQVVEAVAEQDDENRPMSDADWQQHAYGPFTQFATTQEAIDRINKELGAVEAHVAEMKAREKRILSRIAAEREQREAEQRWNALPPEAQALGCQHCRTMNHPAEVCMNQELTPFRKRIVDPDGTEYYITSWASGSPLIATELDLDELPTNDPIQVKRAPKISTTGRGKKGWDW